MFFSIYMMDQLVSLLTLIFSEEAHRTTTNLFQVRMVTVDSVSGAFGQPVRGLGVARVEGLQHRGPGAVRRRVRPVVPGDPPAQVRVRHQPQYGVHHPETSATRIFL